MHVVTSRRRHKGREYETTLVRRSYRDGDRVRKQTLANLSHLPPEAIDAVRRVLRGRYQKHDWPEDPLTAMPRARPGRR